MSPKGLCGINNPHDIQLSSSPQQFEDGIIFKKVTFLYTGGHNLLKKYYIRIEKSFGRLLLPLEEISTQNGPPKRTNKIFFINFGGRKEKNYFFVCIFDISPYFFTQILIGRARWMRN